MLETMILLAAVIGAQELPVEVASCTSDLSCEIAAAAACARGLTDWCEVER
jgi:hypothetical protein